MAEVPLEHIRYRPPSQFVLEQALSGASIGRTCAPAPSRELCICSMPTGFQASPASALLRQPLLFLRAGCPTRNPSRNTVKLSSLIIPVTCASMKTGSQMTNKCLQPIDPSLPCPDHNFPSAVPFPAAHPPFFPGIRALVFQQNDGHEVEILISSPLCQVCDGLTQPFQLISHCGAGLLTATVGSMNLTPLCPDK